MKYLHKKKLSLNCFLLTGCILILFSTNHFAQNYMPTPNDTLNSPIVHSDSSITFRVYAPNATEVKMGGTDFPNDFRNKALIKQSNGIWQVTFGPIKPGAYRYNFIIDGITVIDSRNTLVSESNMNVWSLVYVPGSDFMETKPVPHGSISEVTYFSSALNRFRRMHVYTPPGYESGKNKYPVFYLLHGAFDCDAAWPTVGRAGFILDNLIAEKKAEPMVVVMPAGHTGPFWFGRPPSDPSRRVDEFLKDFLGDIKPYIEKNYRVYTERDKRAIAGLSMGGAQTLNIAIPNLKEYSYIGVYSSGVFGIDGNNPFGNNEGPTWVEQNKSHLENEELKEGLKLLWFATGKDDFLLNLSRATVDTLKAYGFDVTYQETNGGHTWVNWRNYLFEFAQMIFKD